MPADEDEARAFARAFTRFLVWLQPWDQAPSNPVVARLRAHLGAEGVDRSVVARELPPFQQVNLQVALEAWGSAPGRRAELQGFTVPPQYGSVEMAHLLSGEGLPPLRDASPDLVDLPSGPGRTTACWKSALLLVEDARGRYAVLVRGPERHQEPTLTLEVAGLDTTAAQEVLAEVEVLRDEHDVHRGQVLAVEVGALGGTVITFPVLPVTTRDDVVLPEAVLRRIERHSLDVADHRDALRASGQHLKRGLLLHGPPGTGKTHTTRYLVQQLPGTTTLLLSGRSLHLVGPVAQLARDLQPSVVVLEDVDLVAEDRSHGPGTNPVLFELLDAMDGAAGDADLLFLLTTNRADLLEPALAARPGRVDVAVEVGLPDAAARRRLLALCARGVEWAVSTEQVDVVVARTEGVTASFVKELVRRSVLESLSGDPGAPGAPTAVVGEHVARALDDLLDSRQGVTRALLGVPGTTGAPGAPAG